MGQEINSAKSLRKKKTKTTCPPPSCRQLAERFIELQRLRQKVRAAESGRKRRPRDKLIREASGVGSTSIEMSAIDEEQLKSKLPAIRSSVMSEGFSLKSIYLFAIGLATFGWLWLIAWCAMALLT